MDNEFSNEGFKTETEIRLQDKLDVALLLLYAIEKTVTQQKMIEALCDYPDNYGADPFVLVQMQAFLNIKEVKERLKELQKKKTN